MAVNKIIEVALGIKNHMVKPYRFFAKIEEQESIKTQKGAENGNDKKRT